MAEKALNKLEDQLNCSICLDTYTDPKLLQCFHAYCKQCLVPLVDRDQQGQLGLSCPTCRQVTPIPDRGVAGLQSAFLINDLLDIKESLQKAENAAATPKEAAPGTESDVTKCPVHEGKKLELFCETCGDLICTRCGLKGGKHHDHGYEELQEAFQKCKVDFMASLEPMDEQVTIMKEALMLLDMRSGEVCNQRTATKENIHVNFRQLREILLDRETEIISQLDQETEKKLKGLAAQRDQAETTLAQLNSCLLFMRESLRTSNKGDVLKMKVKIAKRVKELTAPFQPDKLEPNTEADMMFAASADMTTVCRNYGQVVLPLSPDPSKCSIAGKGAEVAEAGERSTAILQAVNFAGNSCEKPVMSLECELESKITNSTTTCSVERRGQSQYEISYQPTIKGRHQLHIKVQGQHIRGSPFSIAVTSPVEKLGTPIQIIHWVRPWGVAVNQKSEVVVTGWGYDCMSVFSPSGQKLRSFGTGGSGRGQCDRPCGVAVDREGNILVADGWNHRIQKFTAQGQFLKTVNYSVAPIQFNLPTGIAFHDKIFVADRRNQRVQILNSDLTLYSTFGKKGDGRGQFSTPWDIACDSTGKVYVADGENNRIQVFTAEGKFLRMFGRHGQGRGELDWPIGVAIDTSNRVYVCEAGNHRISVFTAGGHFVTSFGKQGEGLGEFMEPRGLTVDSSGVVYVCDNYNGRIQMF